MLLERDLELPSDTPTHKKYNCPIHSRNSIIDWSRAKISITHIWAQKAACMQSRADRLTADPLGCFEQKFLNYIWLALARLAAVNNQNIC